MTPTSLSLKKALQEPEKNETEEKENPLSPLEVEKDLPREKRFLDLLLDHCKEKIGKEILKEKKEVPENLDPSLFSLPQIPPMNPISFSTSASFQAPPISSIPEECLQILDKLCSEMLVMNVESCVRTTFVLETNAFINSPFYKATVTIEEYSTAPKIFNVSITANQFATELLNAQMGNFFELLETRNFSFGIHKIDTYVSTDSWYQEKGQDSQEDHQEKEDS